MDKNQQKIDPLKGVKFNRGGSQQVLRTYVKLHQLPEVTGKHWLWKVVERASEGEDIDEILKEYGYDT